MSETKHAPGPWSYQGDYPNHCIRMFDAKDALIADVRLDSNDPASDQVAHYTADLIAAAPDLLAACELVFAHLPKHIREYLRSYDSEEEGWDSLARRLRVIGPDAFDPEFRVRIALACRAAIAKAKGVAS